MSTNKTALVLGASGLVGNELVKTLIQRNQYNKIHLLIRRPIENFESPVCEQFIADFDKLEAYSELFQVTDVFCCLGTTIKKAKSKEVFRKVDFEYPLEAAKLALKGGAEKFLIVSAMGADSKSRFFYNQVKGDVEKSLKTLNLRSLHIFRPSLLLGKRKEFRFGEKLAAKASGLLNKVMVGPLRPYKAIEAKKVALAMAITAESGKNVMNTYPSHEIERIANQK
ncbi:NAD-dependent epimerase/dehydratase [Neobacillus bataviensis LMG 21833]|uniref:NAD-dependent epimerase/dehydratase n=1 Tax=Neobacillus bataviensis LMG 21833 TaxID=1117379 RepID=K6E8T9_9BACI|nr:oxidoreductase [Neobacillus bataviensis]EKN69756.1 NAD-dependent epimerase/dehydratase [Neobacillus bataviensis LMG 21833]